MESLDVDIEIERLASAFDGADLAVPVPSCPGWTLRDLAQHVGTVHRWAAHHVATYAPARVPSAELGIEFPDDDAGYADWLREGGSILLGAFAGADGDVEMWAWGADKHARFWPRRMVHETAVHRADAELSMGREPDLDPLTSADGIDELLDNLPCAAYFAPNVENLRGEGMSLAFEAVDAEAAWLVVLRPNGFQWERIGGLVPASIEVRGHAADLLLLLYGRRHPDEGRFVMTGDRDVLAHWLANSAL